MPMPDRFSYPLSHGAQLIGNGKTRFRLWAPTAQSVAVVLKDGTPMPMQKDESGWFEALADCAANTRYQYQVVSRNGDAMMVPDPASRAQDGDVRDASIVIDPHAFQWHHPQWKGRPWHETVLYEAHAGVLGGFEGVTARLSKLAALGITAIELMPVNDFPGARNWGYDGVLPFAPDAAYGTPEQLKRLIDTAHSLGMMVFLDVVCHHFGTDGNYVGIYAADFFRDDINTPWGPAIDFRRTEVDNFFIENALYWLHEYRFDGLRFDAAHAIHDQGWLKKLAQRIRASVEPERHIHLVLEHDGNAAHLMNGSDGLFNAQWNDDGHHVLHVLLTGEDDGYYADYAEEPASKLARFLAEGFVYQGEPSPYRAGVPRGEPSAHLPPTAFVLFLQNHDQTGSRAMGERLIALAPPAALRAARALILLAPQIPLMFMGEEAGVTEPFLYFTSYRDPALADAVCAGRRQEFPRFPSFADEEQRAQIADPNNEETFRRSIPRMDGASDWLDWTAHVLAIRHAHIIPRLRSAKAIGAIVLGPAAVAARWHLGDGSVLVIAINLASEDVPLNIEAISNTGGADLLFETEDSLTTVDAGYLPAYGFLTVLEPAA